jgi:hypothetical protein
MYDTHLFQKIDIIIILISYSRHILMVCDFEPRRRKFVHEGINVGHPDALFVTTDPPIAKMKLLHVDTS